MEKYSFPGIVRHALTGHKRWKPVWRALDYLYFPWPAGFYNKTFIWPGWRWYEGAIRHLAGLGRLPTNDDPDTYQHRHAHCDVLVIGGGAAGLSAALASMTPGRSLLPNTRGCSMAPVARMTCWGCNFHSHCRGAPAATSLWAGRARYGLMLNENGVVIDDGVVARIEDNSYLLHTSSGGAERIRAWLEALLQGDWPDLNLILTPVTRQWANVTVCGPQARELLERLDTSLDLSAEGLPHMGIASGALGDVPLRVLRAGYTGELSYELNVPADRGAVLWNELLRLGAELQATPLGIEALMVLRTEKGYLHIGADTDGNTTPRDLGWSRVVERKAADFLGKRSLSRPANICAGRLEFVGISTLDEGDALMAGAHIIAANCSGAPAPTQGYVTSACYSPNLNRHVGLGLVQDGSKRLGEIVNLYDNGRVQAVRLSAPAAWDPAGERMRV